MILKSSFDAWQCEKQPVFLRVDMNVPLVAGTIEGDYKLRALEPTLKALIKKRAIILLATHIGNPEKNDAALSTKHLLSWFKDRKYQIIFCPTLTEAKHTTQHCPEGTIILLENLRFFPEEKTSNQQFVTELHDLASWYILDAFGTLHRNDASLAPLAETYSPERRSIGYLIEQELEMLNHIVDHPKKPISIFLGGGKIDDKIPLIERFIAMHVDYIFLCPAIVFTFEAVQRKNIGQSLVSEKNYDTVRSMLAKMGKTQLMFPLDYQIARGSLNGPLSYADAGAIPADSIGISIGPKTVSCFHSYIQKSRTIFYNGMMGFFERKETLHGIESLLKNIAQSAAFSVVAGGESVSMVNYLALRGINYCSTGGGATLAYLSGASLPALIPFLKDGTKTN